MTVIEPAQEGGYRAAGTGWELLLGPSRGRTVHIPGREESGDRAARSEAG